ncbi:glycosyltransferase family 2 protein [Candidatus Woesebacteria bacterium]|nr:glycosyltransferase family 2 protein [Candidatus Woesebacteria bacterium]
MQQKPFFSIVIPTLNEAEYLPHLLSDLADQTYTNFEVILVDAYSDDSTIVESKKFNETLIVKTTQSDIKNVSHQRNLGIELAEGDWVIFMDADNRLPKYFLDGIRYRLAQKPSTDIFTTWVKVSGDKKVNEYIEKIMNFGIEFYNSIGKESAFGSMIGVKNQIAKENPFDTKQKVMEDSLFVKTIVDAHYTFSIFKDPKYTYSLRRIEANGLLKHIQINSKMVFNYYVLGNDFQEDNHGYEMNGGKSYEKTDGTLFNMFYELESIIKTKPAQRLEEAKKLFKSIIKSIDN